MGAAASALVLRPPSPHPFIPRRRFCLATPSLHPPSPPLYCDSPISIPRRQFCLATPPSAHTFIPRRHFCLASPPSLNSPSLHLSCDPRPLPPFIPRRCFCLATPSLHPPSPILSCAPSPSLHPASPLFGCGGDGGGGGGGGEDTSGGCAAAGGGTRRVGQEAKGKGGTEGDEMGGQGRYWRSGVVIGGGRASKRFRL